MPEILTKVINMGLCTGCGACEALCPYDAVSVDERPQPQMDKNTLKVLQQYGVRPKYENVALLNDECVDCYACQRVCPALHDHPEDEFDNMKRILAGKSTIQGQDGGIVSRIVQSLLTRNQIDCAMGVVRDEKWRAKPILITRPDEVEIMSGTKYTATPVVSLLKEVVDSYDRIAVVGTPCQAHAASLFRWEISDNIKLILGLFCMESFAHATFCEGYIPEEMNVDIKSVRKMDFDKGKFVVYTDEEDHRVPIKDIAKYARSPCHHCLDFSSYYADISVGSVGSPPGWSTIVIRNDIGEKYFGRVTEIEEGEANIDFVKKLAGMKHEKNQ